MQSYTSSRWARPALILRISCLRRNAAVSRELQCCISIVVDRESWAWLDARFPTVNIATLQDTFYYILQVISATNESEISALSVYPGTFWGICSQVSEDHHDTDSGRTIVTNNGAQLYCYSTIRQYVKSQLWTPAQGETVSKLVLLYDIYQGTDHQTTNHGQAPRVTFAISGLTGRSTFHCVSSC